MRDMKMNFFMLFFIGLFVLIMAFVFFDKPLQTVTRASASVVEISKCLMIASKLEAKATGQDPVEVTVFVRNAEGGAIENKSVSISTTLGAFSSNSGTSDKYGRVIFNLNSDATGNADIAAIVEGQKINQLLTIKFTE